MALFYLCLKIFCVRIIDVSLGTFRTIITVKGKALYASLIGFIEIFVWFIIVREALNTDIDSIWIAISYSLGFATGTYIGAIISDRFIKYNFRVEIITSNSKMEHLLRELGYGVTTVSVKGKDADNSKYMLIVETDSNKLNKLKDNIKKNDKQAFLMITETKYVQNGYFIK